VPGLAKVKAMATWEMSREEPITIGMECAMQRLQAQVENLGNSLLALSEQQLTASALAAWAQLVGHERQLRREAFCDAMGGQLRKAKRQTGVLFSSNLDDGESQEEPRLNLLRPSRSIQLGLQLGLRSCPGSFLLDVPPTLLRQTALAAWQSQTARSRQRRAVAAGALSRSLRQEGAQVELFTRLLLATWRGEVRAKQTSQVGFVAVQSASPASPPNWAWPSQAEGEASEGSQSPAENEQRAKKAFGDHRVHQEGGCTESALGLWGHENARRVVLDLWDDDQNSPKHCLGPAQGLLHPAEEPKYSVPDTHIMQSSGSGDFALPAELSQEEAKAMDIFDLASSPTAANDRLPTPMAQRQQPVRMSSSGRLLPWEKSVQKLEREERRHMKQLDQLGSRSWAPPAVASASRPPRTQSPCDRRRRDASPQAQAQAEPAATPRWVDVDTDARRDLPRGPERFFYDTSSYTGCARFGGPAVLEKGAQASPKRRGSSSGAAQRAASPQSVQVRKPPSAWPQRLQAAKRRAASPGWAELPVARMQPCCA